MTSDEKEAVQSTGSTYKYTILTQMLTAQTPHFYWIGTKNIPGLDCMVESLREISYSEASLVACSGSCSAPD